MAECQGCGREAGTNKVFCGDDCVRLANGHAPRTVKQMLMDAYTRGRHDGAREERQKVVDTLWRGWRGYDQV